MWYVARPINQDIRGYDVGELPIRGAVTVELLTVPNIPLQAFMDVQYGDSKTMDQRPGMYMKYLPYRYEAATGSLLSGGTYLFDTWENAKDYGRWTMDEFQTGEPKMPFFQQPVFLDSGRQVWRVAGAHCYAPIQEHAAGRLVRWSVSSGIDEHVMRELYPALRDAAHQQGAVGFVLLYAPDDGYVGIYQTFSKVADGSCSGSSGSTSEDFLRTIEAKSSLQQLFPNELGLESRFDRSSLFLTLWLPRSREQGGAGSAYPNYPVVPNVSVVHL